MGIQSKNSLKKKPTHLFIFERQRKTEGEQGRRREKGNTEFEAGSRLLAVNPEPDTGLELGNREIMT